MISWGKFAVFAAVFVVCVLSFDSTTSLELSRSVNVAVDSRVLSPFVMASEFDLDDEDGE
jgi:hypothetical protein